MSFHCLRIFICLIIKCPVGSHLRGICKNHFSILTPLNGVRSCFPSINCPLGPRLVQIPVLGFKTWLLWRIIPFLWPSPLGGFVAISFSSPSFSGINLVACFRQPLYILSEEFFDPICCSVKQVAVVWFVIIRVKKQDLVFLNIIVRATRELVIPD